MELWSTRCKDANWSSAYLFILRVLQTSFNKKKCIANTSDQLRNAWVISSNSGWTFLVALKVFYFVRSRFDARCITTWNVAVLHATC